jgi:hypothetical protein
MGGGCWTNTGAALLVAAAHSSSATQQLCWLNPSTWSNQTCQQSSFSPVPLTMQHWAFPPEFAALKRYMEEIKKLPEWHHTLYSEDAILRGWAVHT